MNKNSFAPVVIFAYNRPDKLSDLLESLKCNKELRSSDLYFYIDSCKNNNDLTLNQKVIELAEDFKDAKSITINKAKDNLGLKENILRGVNDTFNKNSTGIFLEDDLIVSKYFLKYMNDSLQKYRNSKKIFHISGYNNPNFSGDKNSCYFTYYMSCWGWATWRDKWEQNVSFQKNLISKQSKLKRLKFNVYGFERDFESQLINNDNKVIKTWAIYWSQHVFLSNGLCLNPIKSLVNNVGADGSGANQGKTDAYKVEINNSQILKFPKNKRFKLNNRMKVINFYYKKNKAKKTSS